MQRIIARICINEAAQLGPQIDRAVHSAIEEALISQIHGVLVVRHDSYNFTVGLSSEVPFGTTRTLDQRGIKIRRRISPDGHAHPHKDNQCSN